MAPSIRYMNQSAPFWDFVASLENQGTQHPFFHQGRDRDVSSSDEDGAQGPWGWGIPFRPHGGWGWAGPRGREPRHHHGPPRPEGPEGFHGPGDEKRKEGEGEKENNEEPPKCDDGEPGPAGPDPRHRHHHGGRRGRAHGRHGWQGPPGPWNMGPLGDFIQSQFLGQDGQDNGRAQDFAPDVDVFDTETAFVIHASVPGAKKEDINISWDQEKSELSITGVTFRPGDEEFLKTLAMDERKVGAFERKVRLGSRAQPAQVEKEGVQAKMEDGILFVKVPKLGQDLVEIMKVDID